jgi:hypothetical protein
MGSMCPCSFLSQCQHSSNTSTRHMHFKRNAGMCSMQQSSLHTQWSADPPVLSWEMRPTYPYTLSISNTSSRHMQFKSIAGFCKRQDKY